MGLMCEWECELQMEMKVSDEQLKHIELRRVIGYEKESQNALVLHDQTGVVLS